jgi:uncharacterized protein YyaL (SSP411 family)
MSTKVQLIWKKTLCQGCTMNSVRCAFSRFGDGAGGLYFSSVDPLLPLRQVIATDAALPAGVAVAAEVLVRLGVVTGEPQHRQRARELVRALGDHLSRAPLGCAHLLSAALLLEERAP